MSGAPRAVLALAVVRVVVGVLALVFYLKDYFRRHLLFGVDGVYGIAAVEEITRDLGTFNLYLLFPNEVAFEIIYHLAILVAVAVVFGLGGRFSIAAHYALLWSTFNLNPSLLDGGDNLQMVVVPALILTQCSTRLAFHAGGRPRQVGVIGSVLNNTGLLIIAGQVCIVYLMSGLYKVQGRMWQDGTALYYILRVPEFYFPGVTEILFALDWALVLAAYGTVLASIAFPFLVLFKKGRLPAVLIMTVFHFSIAIFMGLTSFALVMIACDLLFVNRHVESLGRRLRSWWLRTAQDPNDGEGRVRDTVEMSRMGS